jgi:very-short-patch-repair endonuclease
MGNRINPYNPKLKEIARELQKNSTLGEVLLWKQIKGRSLGVEFHRQVPIDNFIVDFYCHELLLAVEIDGRIHLRKDVRSNDLHGQNRLEELGVRFIRINDADARTKLPEVLKALSRKISEVRLEGEKAE